MQGVAVHARIRHCGLALDFPATYVGDLSVGKRPCRSNNDEAANSVPSTPWFPMAAMREAGTQGVANLDMR